MKIVNSPLTEIRQIKHEEENLKIETTKPDQSINVCTVCTEIVDHVSNFNLKYQLTE